MKTSLRNVKRGSCLIQNTEVTVVQQRSKGEPLAKTRKNLGDVRAAFG
jgi:hypothetical protein